jgi:hypothetical protein
MNSPGSMPVGRTTGFGSYAVMVASQGSDRGSQCGGTPGVGERGGVFGREWEVHRLWRLRRSVMGSGEAVRPCTAIGVPVRGMHSSREA